MGFFKNIALPIALVGSIAYGAITLSNNLFPKTEENKPNQVQEASDASQTGETDTIDNWIQKATKPDGTELSGYILTPTVETHTLQIRAYIENDSAATSLESGLVFYQALADDLGGRLGPQELTRILLFHANSNPLADGQDPDHDELLNARSETNIPLNIYITPEEAANFYADIQNLRNDPDRLESRLYEIYPTEPQITPTANQRNPNNTPSTPSGLEIDFSPVYGERDSAHGPIPSHWQAGPGVDYEE